LKLPVKTLFHPEKFTRYLLTYRKRNDKSQWLSQAGYSLENWQVLENDLREQILSCDAKPIEDTEYGQLYEIVGTLVGPNGRKLSVNTIWIAEAATGNTKFITMFPGRGKERR